MIVKILVIVKPHWYWQVFESNTTLLQRYRILKNDFTLDTSTGVFLFHTEPKIGWGKQLVVWESDVHETSNRKDRERMENSKRLQEKEKQGSRNMITVDRYLVNSLCFNKPNWYKFQSSFNSLELFWIMYCLTSVSTQQQFVCFYIDGWVVSPAP